MTWRRTVVPALAAAAGLSLGGCGGSDEPVFYRLAPTKSCLQKANVRVTTRGLDFIARNALGGGLHATFSGNQVTLAFGKTEEGARGIEIAYRRFAGKGIPIDKILMRDRNVVMVWTGGPSPSDLGTVTDCLGASG